MFAAFARRLFGSRNQRTVKRHRRAVADINRLEAPTQALSDDALRARAQELRAKLAAAAPGARPAARDARLPEVFALVREAARRGLGLRHFDVQLIGGMVLHEGGIAEMRTGEGKTLAATLPAGLHALAGESVHVVTVNDYLARRDAAWMRPVYERLGLSVGVIVQGLDGEQRRAAYAADITYGTNNEFGFDYLRDNMALRAEHQVMRALDFAIVDEVDSILIDEARTPLIISGPAADSSELYRRMDALVRDLEPQAEEEGPGDFRLDEKARQAHLTEDGHHRIEQRLAEAGLIPDGSSLYETGNIRLLHHVTAALRAHSLFRRDRDYIVSPEGKIVIIDEFTGRKTPGRRWSDGLHQAIEAKEGVAVETENQTVASITFQNYFRLYGRLSGMTGTADTEAYEFQEIYGLDVVVVPTHLPMVREDRGDYVFLTAAEKSAAVIEDVRECVARGQPVLVGTTSIASSEHFSGQLAKAKIAHQVLNAKQHERESHVIAQAGRPGAVTIATNMAGRGTDIVLGGAPEEPPAAADDADAADAAGATDAAADAAAAARAQAEWQARHDAVVAAGGLHIIGTERHESRRVDNQLRGRSGRQGDPGSSRFYLSLEDSLIRIFASDRMAGMMQRLGMKEGEVIEHPWVTKAIGNAQRKVEAHNFDIRKHLLEFDDVNNDQRRVVYGQRNELLQAADLRAHARTACAEAVRQVVAGHVAAPEGAAAEDWDAEGLRTALAGGFGLELPVADWLDEEPAPGPEEVERRAAAALAALLDAREERFGADTMRQLEKDLLLTTLDLHWKEHLGMMEHLRQGIGLRSYAQKNPKQEYKREAFGMFQEMLDRVDLDFAGLLCRLELREEEEPQLAPAAAPPLEYRHQSAGPLDAPPLAPVSGAQPQRRRLPKVGRNDPCPCGSGRKYKRCCGARADAAA